MLQTIVVQYGRFFRRSPLVTTLAGVVLAIGFTSSAVALTIMLAMTAPRSSGLRSLAYATVAEETNGGGSQAVSWETFERLRDSAVWSDPVLVAYAEPIRAHLSYKQTEQEISVAAASIGFFTSFVHLDTGEDYASSSTNENSDREVVLTSAFAERLFSNDGEAVGRIVVLNDQTFRVIGVAPKSFNGLWSHTDAWVTPRRIVWLDFGSFRAEGGGTDKRPSVLDNPGAWKKPAFFYVLAGSRFSPEEFRQKLGRLVREPALLDKHLNVNDGLTKDPVWDRKVRAWAQLALLISIALILAASLNYCGLLLAQAPRYIEEVRLKRVLGASVLRILAENMCGPVVTVLASFLLAFCTAGAAIWVLAKQGAHFLPASRGSWQIALGILGLGLAIACVLSVVVGSIPSLRLLHDSGAPRIGYTHTVGKKTTLGLYAIVSGQIASCVLICLVAAMIGRAVRSSSQEVLGFDSRRLIALEIGPATKTSHIEFSTGGAGDFPLARFARSIVQGAPDNIPEVKQISAASCAPLVAPMRTISLQRMDRSLPARSIHFCAASQSFFKAMGNRIVQGHTFSNDGFTGEVTELVINHQLASEMWPGEDPLHRTVRIEEPSWGLEFDAEVVGIAEDMRFSGWSTTPDATAFLPLQGNVFTLSFPLYFLVRGTESPRSIEEFTRQQAATYMPSLGVSTTYQVDERLRQSFTEQAVRVWFSAGGAVVIAIIAYLGLYGVLVHSVNWRRREMALRVCFGASSNTVRKMVIRQALLCSLFALAISMLAWKPLTIVTGSIWFGKLELSWQVAGGVSLMCVAAAAIISLFPASTAARVAPAEVLREQ